MGLGDLGLGDAEPLRQPCPLDELEVVVSANPVPAGVLGGRQAPGVDALHNAGSTETDQVSDLGDGEPLVVGVGTRVWLRCAGAASCGGLGTVSFPVPGQAIVRELADQVGGAVSLEDGPAGGMTARMALPAASGP